ncbi:hypothetical protein AB0J71_16600 [Nonomuraea sp. NPDC049637]|uniref:hypothetical protein n=1 Tax=Nonomuraea sp. NPDC049637 TaxID=3154356 RepID=UPI0034496707
MLTAHARAEEDRVYPGLDAHHGVEEHKEAELRELGKAFLQRREEELRALKGGGAAGPTKAELYEQAKEADILGRSQMDKDELQEALSRAKS